MFVLNPGGVRIPTSSRRAPFEISAPSFDPDAAAYFAASGATDKANLDSFVRQVKSTIDWTKFVCWPARSGQNKGSGTTLFSLGGLSRNGTFGGSPTWVTDGIRRAAGTAGYVTFATIDTATPDAASVFAVFKLAAYPNGSQIIPVAVGNGGADALLTNDAFTLYTDNANHEWRVTCREMTGGDGARHRGLLNGATDFRDGNFHAGFGSIGSAASFTRVAIIDGTSLGSDGGSGTARDATPDSGILLACQTANTVFDATLAFAGVSTEAISSASLISLYGIYKNTIGQGLSLP